ncbi:MAG TPA: hypothetical protein PL105_07140, partial [Caldilineaceae bacterium]|nr:hypothetical protein [Caldilineaceae bacterium]
QRVVLYDGIAKSRQVFRSRTNPATGEVGAPILSGNGTVLFYEDEGGISAVECSISDLGLTTNTAPASAVAGETLAYVWTVSNLDQAIASGIQVQATLPAGLAIRTIEPAAACTVSGQKINCAFSRLEMGQSQTMTATLRAEIDSSGDLTTQIIASSLTTVDRNPANNSQSLITRVSAQADLGIVKTASPDTALQGEEITYTLSISSTGPSLARNVQVTDTLPPGLAFVSSPSCVASSGQALCALGNLLPGDHLTVTIRTRVATFQELDIVNQAKIGSETTDDPAPLNNRTAITNSVNTKFDLAVVGAVAPVPLVAGAPITYSYAVTNFGPSVADNVELSVTLPAELYAIGQPQVLGAGSCITGTVFICDLGSLPRTQAVTVIVTGRISSTLSGPILSLAAVRSTTEANADRNPANDQTGVTSDVVQQADLRVVKSISAASVVAGNMLTYTLGVVNLGPSTAPAVTVTDTLPNEVAITGLATSLGACAGSTLVICTLSSLPPGEQATVTVTVRVNISALGVITNTADGSSTIFDPNPFNNVASISTAVTGVADLTLVKSASVSFAIAGQDSYYYDLAVGNLGPSLARNVFLTDTLPAGLSYTGFSGPAGVVCADQGGEVIGCSLNDAIPGITQTVRIDVATTSGAPGSLVNNALVTSFTPDPTPANSASATVTASQLSDLQVTKQATINNLNVGGTVTYTVNVDNFGPSNATGVVIHDLLPGALTAPSVSVVQGSYSLTSGLWTVGNVAAGQKLTMTVAGSIGSAASGQVVTNAALLYALDQTDPQLFNNGQVVTFTVPLNADLSLAQSLSSLSPPVQSTLSLVLTATNHGPETATNVQVRDLLPASLAFVSQLADSGTYSPTTGLWILPSLGSGVSQALTITAQVIGSGSFTNIASIGAAQYDHNLANNSAAAAFTAAPAADLALTQTVEPSTPNVGDTPVFTVTITNDGPDTASNVQVWDAPGSGSTVTPSAGSSYSATTNLWTIPVLAAGDFATLVISRSLALSGPISNTAEIVASSLFDPDSTPGNGLGNGEDDQVSVTLIVPPAADLGLHMSASGGQLVGQDVLLQIQMTNYGPDVATNIVLTETLPTDLTFSTHLVVGTGSFVPATGRWTIPALGVGDFTILNITARVDNGAAGQLVTDQVEGVSLDQYDPAVFPNDASVSFQVGGADLSITKSVDRAIANVGDPVVYTITVFNDGPSATSNVRITDSLPISLTAIISSTSAGDFGPNTPGGAGVWRIPTLDVGAGETLILTGTVIPGTANRIITNTISAASSSVADANTANHTPAVGFRVTAADLMLQKSATITQPQEGQSFFYILNVTNLGPDPATNVVVTDTMSTGMTTTVAGAGYDLASGRWDVGD